jgi:hypothetical protein
MAGARFVARVACVIIVLAWLTGSPVQAGPRPQPAGRTTRNASSVASCGTWTLFPSVDVGESSQLVAVDAVAADDIWAVGNETTAPQYQGLAEHYDGVSWSVSPTPVLTHQSFFNGVAALSSTDVWAVGTWTNNDFLVRGLTEHWDGSTWIVIPGARVGGSADSQWFFGVAGVASDDVWAVGTFAEASGKQHALAEHWDGSSWTSVPTPDTGTTFSGLSRVVAIAPDDVWAVGVRTFADGKSRALIEHWNGASWELVIPDEPPNGTELLADVEAASSDDLMAVGEGGRETGNGAPIALHWDGTSWSRTAPLPAGDSSFFHGLAVADTADAWAVGYAYNGVTGVLKVLAEHWDGSVWTKVPAQSPPSTSSNLLDAAAVSGAEAWAAGYYNDSTTGTPRTLLEHYCAL